MTGRSSSGATLKSPLFSQSNGILAVFFLHALTAGGLFTRIPDIQTSLGLSEAQLGLVLMGQPIGALSSFIFVSRIVEDFGTRRVLLIALPLLSLGTFAFALSPWPVMAFAAMAAYGASFAFSNVAMNVEADRIESSGGSRVMNRCHGMWSLGFLGAALVGAGARGLPVPPSLHFGLMVPLVLLGAALLLLPMLPAPMRAHTGDGRKPLIALPTLTTFLLVGFGISGALVEGGTRNWSIIYMRDTFAAPEWVDAMTLPAFMLTLTLGRWVSDPLMDRFGAVRVAALLVCTALAGAAMIVLATSLWLAIAGFGLLGFGACAIFPLMISAAARTGDRPASANVSAVTMTISILLLGSPAVLGFVAESFGIRTSFALLIPFLMMTLVLVRVVEPKPQSVD